MSYLLNVLYLLGLLALFPWLFYKSLTTGKHRTGLWRKLAGLAPVRPGAKPCAWIHGVSVGEIHLLRPIVNGFRARHPDWDCMISTTTETGFAEAGKHFPTLQVFYWPLDFSWAVRRALRRVNPTLVILAEGELWPNFLTAARSHGVAVAVINGRLSPRTSRRYQQWGWLARRMLSSVDLFAMQTEEYAACIRALGVDPARICVTGSVKYDGVTADRLNPRTLELRRLFGVEPTDLIWIAGSTQAPEEQFAIDIYRRELLNHPSLRLFLVPRQKERFDDVAALLARSGLTFMRRTQLTRTPARRYPVILMDSIGELGALWGLADVAFVGGSLDGRRGGQNMIEPAAYGTAVIFGPHIWNFKETATRLIGARAAVQVADSDQLAKVIHDLLQNNEERLRLGNRARLLVQAQQGATGRTLDWLDRLPALQRPAERAA
jgi:3-deoxy-D-manno-octulosonic-acid transferase